MGMDIAGRVTSEIRMVRGPPRDEREVAAMMWGYPGYGWVGFIWMALSAVFWLALLGVLIWALVHWLSRGPSRAAAPPPPPPPVSALTILQQRYARGEIDEPTYLRIREQLEAPRAPDTVGTGQPQ